MIREEFKDFISRGSAIDMAVGIIIGGDFTSIVNSIVEDILMPPIGPLLKGVDFDQGIEMPELHFRNCTSEFEYGFVNHPRKRPVNPGFSLAGGSSGCSAPGEAPLTGVKPGNAGSG